MTELKIKINCGKKTCGKCKKKYYNKYKSTIGDWDIKSRFARCSLFSEDGDGKVLFETDDGQILRLPNVLWPKKVSKKKSHMTSIILGRKNDFRKFRK